MTNHEEHPHLMLSSTVLQAGHSGSPVFDPQGVLVGIIVQSYQFAVSTQQPTDPIHTLPVMSCTVPVMKEIRDAIASV